MQYNSTNRPFPCGETLDPGRNFGRMFLINGVVEGIVAEIIDEPTSNLPPRYLSFLPPRLCDIVRAQCRMSIIVHQADFSTCLILPPSGNTLSLDLKREKAKFQVKPCSSSLDSRGRAFPLRKKKKKGNYHATGMLILYIITGLFFSTRIKSRFDTRERVI